MNFIQSNEVFKGDFDIIDSLDSEASRRLFVGFPERNPTLETALRAAKIKDYDIILEDSRRYADAAKKDPEIAKLGLSDDEAGAISCYTLQGTDDVKSPYQVINEGLAGSRNRTGLASIGRLLFLLLSGLRKLPRTRPSHGQIFYRGIRAKVPQTRDEAIKMDGNGMTVTHQYYEKGRTVTWWGFTSTTTNMEVPYDFIQGAAASTLFHIGGEDLWGYVIKAFSEYPKEDEILLEPEAKVLVNRLKNLETFSMIEVILQPFNHLALEDIIPVGNVSPISAQVGQSSVIKTGSVGSFSDVQGKSAFYNQKEGNFAATPPMPATSWSDGVPFLPQNTFNIQKKWDCAWKGCPSYVNQMVRYSVSPYNPRVAAKMVAGDNSYCTIIGNAFVPLNTVTSWSVKVMKSKNNDGDLIFIGVAPSDINQNGYDYNTMCGWYLHCQNSTLWSGPPHNYRGKGYSQHQMIGFGRYTNVGVLMDTAKGELSFVLNGVNRGVAYGRIPLDKPLITCVLLWKYGDSVELDISGATNETSLVPVPSNLTVKNVAHDSITLAWNEVVGAAYEIEVNGSKSLDTSTTNTFAKKGLLSDTEHSFRVRTVRGSSVSEWSSVVKGRTLKKKTYECVWKKCPSYVYDIMKYRVYEKNLSIATKINGDGWCATIGSTHIPLNTVTSWSIMILKSKNNDGQDICIGIAPSDINQNAGKYDNGWCFDCYYSTLISRPPHKYWDKEYGPRKGKGGYVHTGDSVGVVVDTRKGELSFVLNGVNLGVAYEGVPFDKPLVPCILLYWQGDSVELTI